MYKYFSSLIFIMSGMLFVNSMPMDDRMQVDALDDEHETFKLIAIMEARMHYSFKERAPQDATHLMVPYAHKQNNQYCMSITEIKNLLKKAIIPIENRALTSRRDTYLEPYMSCVEGYGSLVDNNDVLQRLSEPQFMMLLQLRRFQHYFAEDEEVLEGFKNILNSNDDQLIKSALFNFTFTPEFTLLETLQGIKEKLEQLNASSN